MPNAYLMLALLIPVAYLAGSIPFGLIVGLARGIDPRTAGSGNIGATNVGRLLGGKYFALVFILDLCKSLIPMLAAGAILHLSHPSAAHYTWRLYLLWLLVGFAAVCGHMFSIFLGFKGGKGVATSAGMVLGLYPFYTIPGLLGLLVWLIIFLVWRYVSLASIIAAVAFPVFYGVIGSLEGWPLLGQQLPLLICALAVASMIVIRHRANIARLLAGTEHGFKSNGGNSATCCEHGPCGKPGPISAGH